MICVNGFDEDGWHTSATILVISMLCYFKLDCKRDNEREISLVSLWPVTFYAIFTVDFPFVDERSKAYSANRGAYDGILNADLRFNKHIIGT